MSFLPAVLMLAGTAVSAVGSIVQGQQQAKMAQAEGETNARIAEMQAAQVKQSAEYEASKIARAKRQALSRSQMLYAKSGVLISEGSPLEVMADTATQYEMDINATRYNADVTAQRLNYEAAVSRNLSNAQARAYKTAGYFGAASTILTGASSMYKPGYGGAPKTQSPTLTVHPANITPYQRYSGGNSAIRIN